MGKGRGDLGPLQAFQIGAATDTREPALKGFYDLFLITKSCK